MNKKKIISLSILLLFSVCFVLNSCSKDDQDIDTEDENNTEVTLPAEAYRYQIVEVTVAEPLGQEEYDGSLGDVPLKLVRQDTKTLLFCIPGAVSGGEIAFRIPKLNVSQKITVKNMELQADESVVLRSEEHTSELQSRENLVCRLLLEKKNAG